MDEPENAAAPLSGGEPSIGFTVVGGFVYLLALVAIALLLVWGGRKP